MFSILAQNWQGVSRDSFFLDSEPILRAKIENMVSQDYVLCYIPRANGIFWKKLKILEVLLKFSNYIFQRRRQIMTARGVYLANDLLTTQKKKCQRSRPLRRDGIWNLASNYHGKICIKIYFHFGFVRKTSPRVGSLRPGGSWGISVAVGTSSPLNS